MFRLEPPRVGRRFVFAGEIHSQFMEGSINVLTQQACFALQNLFHPFFTLPRVSKNSGQLFDSRFSQVSPSSSSIPSRPNQLSFLKLTGYSFNFLFFFDLLVSISLINVVSIFDYNFPDNIQDWLPLMKAITILTLPFFYYSRHATYFLYDS